MNSQDAKLYSEVVLAKSTTPVKSGLYQIDSEDENKEVSFETIFYGNSFLKLQQSSCNINSLIEKCSL